MQINKRMKAEEFYRSIGMTEKAEEIKSEFAGKTFTREIS